MEVTVYDTLTGDVKFTADLSAAELAENMAEGDAYIEGFVDGRINKVQNGVVVPRVGNFDAVVYSREYRQAFLNDSDWTQVVDAPLSAAEKADWATYRQALRDFPATIQAELANGPVSMRRVRDLIPTPPSE